ncbi:MAG: siroheme synthase CysG [Janthinobacterium lividum]
MRTFPIFLELSGRRALVVGSGEVADRKSDPLLRAGAFVDTCTAFDPACLRGCAIAVGAGAPEDQLQALFTEASRLGIPVNCVDRPELCTFITPAIVDRDPLTIAISSGGAAPVLARLLRARIETLVAPAYGRLGALADAFKAETRRRLPDVLRRRRMLERVLGGRVAELVLAGQDDAARAAYASALDDAERDAQTPERGIVHLVGAGPGSADLLTLRALRLLGEADVIVHDRLVGAPVLEAARRDAERIDVGKSGPVHALPQNEINALLVRLGQEGRKVVRLKGGDPFVFGRGGEEAEALRAAGIAVEIVPGVTAALACAAQAGIPLTHRDAAQSLTFVTGHTPDLDWPALVRSDTLAIYMGLAALPRLRDGLLGAGLDPATPAALVENGGRDAQRLLRGTLDSLAADGPAWAQGGPVLLLVGAVVGRGPKAVESQEGTG